MQNAPGKRVPHFQIGSTTRERGSIVGSHAKPYCCILSCDAVVLSHDCKQAASQPLIVQKCQSCSRCRAKSAHRREKTDKTLTRFALNEQSQLEPRSPNGCLTNYKCEKSDPNAVAEGSARKFGIRSREWRLTRPRNLYSLEKRVKT